MTNNIIRALWVMAAAAAGTAALAYTGPPVAAPLAGLTIALGAGGCALRLGRESDLPVRGLLTSRAAG